MKIQNFAINTAAIYQSGVTTGDTITMQLTHVTGGHLITFEPVILSYAATFFTMQIECVIDISQQDLNDGKIWLIDGDGYYNYVIKKNNVTFESGQLFIQAPQQTIIENTPNNSVIITEFGAGSSGTSGSNGSAGPAGAAGTSGSSGTSSPGVAGTSGVNGTSGINGVAGSSGSSGLTGSSGSSGANGISAGKTYYFNYSQTSDLPAYKVLSEQPSSASQQTVTQTVPAGGTATLANFITPQLGFAVIPSGVQKFSLYFTKQSQNNDIDARVTLQLTDSLGNPIGSPIISQLKDIGWDFSNPVETQIEVVLPTTGINPTNRMEVRVQVINNDSTARDVSFSTENGNYSFVVTSVGVSAATSGSSGQSGAAGSSGSSGVDGATGSSGSSGSSGLGTEFIKPDVMDVNKNIYLNVTPSRNLIPCMFTASAGTPTFTVDRAYYFLTTLKEGMKIDSLTIYNRTANAAIVYYIVIYEAVLVTVGNTELLRPGNVLHTFNTSSFSNATTGPKTLAFLNMTLDASSVKDTYFVGLGVTGANGALSSAPTLLNTQHLGGSLTPTTSPMAFAPTATFNGTFNNNPFTSAPALAALTNGTVPYIIIS